MATARCRWHSRRGGRSRSSRFFWVGSGQAKEKGAKKRGLCVHSQTRQMPQQFRERARSSELIESLCNSDRASRGLVDRKHNTKSQGVGVIYRLPKMISLYINFQWQICRIHARF